MLQQIQFSTAGNSFLSGVRNVDGHGGMVVPHTAASEFYMNVIGSFSHHKTLIWLWS